MSIKSKVLAAAATLTLVSGVGVTGALTAGSATAATPSCGPSCINTFNKDFPPAGLTGGPASPIDVFRQSEKVGNPIILFTPKPTGVGWVVQAVHQVKPSCRSLPTGH